MPGSFTAKLMVEGGTPWDHTRFTLPMAKCGPQGNESCFFYGNLSTRGDRILPIVWG